MEGGIGEKGPNWRECFRWCLPGWVRSRPMLLRCHRSTCKVPTAHWYSRGTGTLWMQCSWFLELWRYCKELEREHWGLLHLPIAMLLWYTKRWMHSQRQSLDSWALLLLMPSWSTVQRRWCLLQHSIPRQAGVLDPSNRQAGDLYIQRGHTKTREDFTYLEVLLGDDTKTSSWKLMNGNAIDLDSLSHAPSRKRLLCVHVNNMHE